MNKQPDDDREVLSITDVPESHTDEMHRRMVKYSLAMGIRLACLLLFFFIDGWARWLFVAGAVFLPWIAVVIANGGSDQSNLKHSDALLDHAPAGELESAEAAAKAAEPVVVPGEIVDEEQEPGTAEGPSAPGEEADRHATGLQRGELLHSQDRLDTIQPGKRLPSPPDPVAYTRFGSPL